MKKLVAIAALVLGSLASAQEGKKGGEEGEGGHGRGTLQKPGLTKRTTVRINRRVSKGLETRERILREATRVVSRDGLEGLSIGPLAESLGMSKSGLFAHFGSKEELQLEVLRTAATDFEESRLVEWKEAHLNVSWVVPLRFAREVDVQTLRQRGQAFHTVRPVEERRCARDEHVESREASTI